MENEKQVLQDVENSEQAKTSKSIVLKSKNEEWIYSIDKVSAFSALMSEEILDFKISQSQDKATSFTSVQESGGAEAMMKIASYLIRKKNNDGFIEAFKPGITEIEAYKFLQNLDIKNYKLMKEVVVDFFTFMDLSQKLLSVWSKELSPLNNPTTLSLMKMFLGNPNSMNMKEMLPYSEETN